MLVDTTLVTDYLAIANNNNNMVQSVDVPIFYHNRINNMADELLSLKWNNHRSTFADVLSVLREQEMFVDVTLACGGKLYPAHKFVLSTCSDYFREMFTKNPCKHPIVFMKDVSGRDLESLLDFMYRGEVNVPQTHLASLIKTAEGLQVKGLAVPDEQQLNPAFIPRNRNHLGSARPPPAPSISPPPKRKRVKEESGYTPVGALNMMYSTMSPQEPNSPYDLSQKSSSSSQSDAVLHNDRTHSISPDQPPPHPSPYHKDPPPSATPYHKDTPPSASPYHKDTHSSFNKDSPEEARPPSRSPDAPRNSRSPPPPSSPPQPPSETRDPSREDTDPLPGPSGMQVKGGEEEEEVEETVVKEDLTIDEEEDETEWCGGNGAGSDGGETTTSGGESTHHDCLPHHYSEASNSSLPTLDPALNILTPTSTTTLPTAHPLPRAGTRDPLTRAANEPLARGTSDSLGMDTSDPRGVLDSLPRGADPLSRGADPPSAASLLDPGSQVDPGNCRQCPLCLKEFKVLGSLKRHYRSHINFKPFVCDICGKRFTLNQYLIEHRRTHTGERPYACHVCGKCFAQTGTLYHHVKNVHQFQ